MDIKNKEDLKNHLDYIKTNYITPVNKDKSLYEYYGGYDNFCDEIGLIIADIDSCVVGKEQYNMHNVANADIRVFEYWKYLDNKTSFKKLISTLKDYSSKLQIEIT